VLRVTVHGAIRLQKSDRGWPRVDISQLYNGQRASSYGRRVERRSFLTAIEEYSLQNTYDPWLRLMVHEVVNLGATRVSFKAAGVGMAPPIASGYVTSAEPLLTL
jgi:hypothetical protein